MARRIVSSAFVSVYEPPIAVVEDSFVVFNSVIVGGLSLFEVRNWDIGAIEYAKIWLKWASRFVVGAWRRPWSLEVPPP